MLGFCFTFQKKNEIEIQRPNSKCPKPTGVCYITSFLLFCLEIESSRQKSCICEGLMFNIRLL